MMMLQWQIDTCLAKSEEKIGKHDDDNEAIIVKGLCSESVIHKHEERYQKFE